MKFIVLTEEQRDIVDGKKLRGRATLSPKNSYVYPTSTEEAIKSILKTELVFIDEEEVTFEEIEE